MKSICLTIAYYAALISVSSFVAKLGVANTLGNKERKKALWNGALMFAIGFFIGILLGIGINLN